MGVCSMPSSKLHLSPSRFSQNIQPTPELVRPQAKNRENDAYISPDSTPGVDFQGVFGILRAVNRGVFQA